MFDDNNRMQIKTLVSLGRKYRIELHTGTENGDERSDCTITTKHNGTDYGGSMELLEAHEGLESFYGHHIPVPAIAINAISEWAYNHGY